MTNIQTIENRINRQLKTVEINSLQGWFNHAENLISFSVPNLANLRDADPEFAARVEEVKTAAVLRMLDGATSLTLTELERAKLRFNKPARTLLSLAA